MTRVQGSGNSDKSKHALHSDLTSTVVPRFCYHYPADAPNCVTEP
jgi:hypothetical protein